MHNYMGNTTKLIRPNRLINKYAKPQSIEYPKSDTKNI